MRPYIILVEIDVSGLSLIEAEQAFRTIRFAFGSTQTPVPGRKTFMCDKEAPE